MRTNKHGQTASPALVAVEGELHRPKPAAHEVGQAVAPAHEGNHCDANWGLPPEEQGDSYEHQDIVQGTSQQLPPANVKYQSSSAPPYFDNDGHNDLCKVLRL